MNKFVAKSLLNSVLANLPKTLSFFTDIIKKHTEEHKKDFVFVFTAVENDLYVVPGTINDDNIFTQKTVNINGTEHESLKLDDFIKKLVEEKMK